MEFRGKVEVDDESVLGARLYRATEGPLRGEKRERESRSCRVHERVARSVRSGKFYCGYEGGKYIHQAVSLSAGEMSGGRKGG